MHHWVGDAHGGNPVNSTLLPTMFKKGSKSTMTMGWFYCTVLQQCSCYLAQQLRFFCPWHCLVLNAFRLSVPATWHTDASYIAPMVHESILPLLKCWLLVGCNPSLFTYSGGAITWVTIMLLQCPLCIPSACSSFQMKKRCLVQASGAASWAEVGVTSQLRGSY